MRLVLGIRAYLTGDNYKELETQVRDANKYFPEAAIVVALCGMEATDYVKNNSTVIHYSTVPLGLTKPLSILINFTKENDYEELILVDGDDQFIISGVRKIYDKHKGDVVIPQRAIKHMFLSDSKISRNALDDLENAFLRVAYDCKLKDLQPGLYMLLNKNAINCINLDNKDMWIGDLILLSQLFKNKFKVKSPEIKVRLQKKTTINLERSFMMLLGAQEYFGINLSKLINIIKKEPKNYLYDSKPSDIDVIEEEFVKYINKSR